MHQKSCSRDTVFSVLHEGFINPRKPVKKLDHKKIEEKGNFKLQALDSKPAMEFKDLNLQKEQQRNLCMTKKQTEEKKTRNQGEFYSFKNEQSNLNEPIKQTTFKKQITHEINQNQRQKGRKNQENNQYLNSNKMENSIHTQKTDFNDFKKEDKESKTKVLQNQVVNQSKVESCHKFKTAKVKTKQGFYLS